LDEFGTTEDQLTLFRYRGYGNPGRTRIETKDGAAFEKTYGELWEDEAGWELETRCKLCPDALGEAADVAAADVWPGGGPTGEDAGFNGVIVRSPKGAELLAAATDVGDIVVGDDITPETFNDLQPHQVRKKQALGARLEGRTDEGLPVIHSPNLRLDINGAKLTAEQRVYQREGARKRAREGKFTEPQS
jgi:coenzyme F420 hydrogenase subunit beta